MDQQDPGRQEEREPSPHSQQGQEAKSSSGDLDATWGLGSASALDSLRRQNFRGRRNPPPSDSKPSSE